MPRTALILATALGLLAAENRNESRARLVAVTGSSGKTTVREMTAAILSQLGDTLATEGNLNNHIGVPLTLFRLAPEHRYGVIELGASGLGEIAHTVTMTRPEVVILTNAGTAHLEGFGGYENIVRAKGEIIDGVSGNGLVVLNRDDPAFEKWRARAGARRVVSVSRLGHAGADYRGALQAPERPGLTFDVSGPDGWSCSATLALEGEHNLTNAMLAIAAAREFVIKHQDHAYSFTDCASFSVMQELNLSQALTKDLHFREAGFLPLLIS